jgi:hypothetical protein
MNQILRSHQLLLDVSKLAAAIHCPLRCCWPENGRYDTARKTQQKLIRADAF